MSIENDDKEFSGAESIRDTIARASAAIESSGETEDSFPETQQPQEPAETEVKRDSAPKQSRKKAASAGGLQDAKAKVEESTDNLTQAVEEEINAPDHWEDGHKKNFSSLSPEMKKFVLEREKAREADYTRKTQEIANARKQAEAFQQVYAPYQAIMKERGIDPVRATEALAKTWHVLATGTPQQKLNELLVIAQQAGIHPQMLMNPQTQPNNNVQPAYPDPNAIQALKSVEELREELKVNAAMSVLESFVAAKDAEGNLLYPYFNKGQVSQNVAKLVPMLKEENPEMSQFELLKKAYDKAIYLDDDVRNEIIEKARRSDVAKKIEQATAAKSKDVSVRGAPNGNMATTSKYDVRTTSIRQALDMAREDLRNAGRA